MVIQLIKDLIFNFRIKRAILRADRNKAETGKKQLVMLYKGKPIVVSKQYLKKCIAAGNYQKGFTVATAEKMALYKTL